MIGCICGLRGGDFPVAVSEQEHACVSPRSGIQARHDCYSQAGRARISPLGLAFLAITSVGWGLNFPIMKHLLTEWPPLSSRGLCGIVGAAALAVIALARRQTLRVPNGNAAAAGAGVDADDRQLGRLHGAGAVVAERQRSGGDRDIDPGLGGVSGVADPRRAAVAGPRALAAGGAGRHRRTDRRQWPRCQRRETAGDVVRVGGRGVRCARHRADQAFSAGDAAAVAGGLADRHRLRSDRDCRACGRASATGGAVDRSAGRR